jgi:hypothetical protein
VWPRSSRQNSSLDLHSSPLDNVQPLGSLLRFTSSRFYIDLKSFHTSVLTILPVAIILFLSWIVTKTVSNTTLLSLFLSSIPILFPDITQTLLLYMYNRWWGSDVRSPPNSSSLCDGVSEPVAFPKPGIKGFHPRYQFLDRRVERTLYRDWYGRSGYRTSLTCRWYSLHVRRRLYIYVEHRGTPSSHPCVQPPHISLTHLLTQRTVSTFTFSTVLPRPATHYISARDGRYPHTRVSSWWSRWAAVGCGRWLICPAGFTSTVRPVRPLEGHSGDNGHPMDTVFSHQWSPGAKVHWVDVFSGHSVSQKLSVNVVVWPVSIECLHTQCKLRWTRNAHPVLHVPV